MLPEGFQSITTKLGSELDIHYETPVQSVEYGEKGVKVMTSKGVFEGDMTVVTLPLGVLKEG
jgi:monoamine oxidase